jgi:ribonuclease HIII
MANITRTINVKRHLDKVLEVLKDKYPSKTIPYGIQFRTENGIVNIYTSGKMVYQGEEAGLEKILQLTTIFEDENSLVFPGVGCDEAGKGEYLGPLVVSCVWVKDRQVYGDLQGRGFMDSKDISKKRLFDLYKWLKETDGHGLKVSYMLYTPEQFDRIYARMGNIARMLDYMYVGTLLKLPLSNQIIIDRYSKGALVDQFIKNIVLETGAEKYFHVAAASVVAKVIYEKWVEQYVPKEIADILRQSHVSINERKRVLSGIDINRWVKNAFKTNNV